ncbi:MAG: GNAT family N-acetyltransferase [Promethearchaeota archaeon]
MRWKAIVENQDIESKGTIDHFPFIKGKNVDLCALNSRHAEIYARWKNDPIVRKYSRNVIPKTLDEQKKRFESQQEKFSEHISFEIWHKKDKKPIGRIGLGYIDWINGWANVYIWIGEKAYWGKNIATEATELLIDYAFTELNLNKLHGGVIIDNIGSWTVAEKLGFVLEGIEEEEIYIDGKYHNYKTFRLLKEDWLEREKNKK